MTGQWDRVVSIFVYEDLALHTIAQVENLFCLIGHILPSKRFSSSGPRWAMMVVAKLLLIVSGIEPFAYCLLNQEESPAKTLPPYATCRCKYIQTPRLKLHRVVIVDSKK